MNDDAALRNRLIRIAHTHPEFRKDLLPLIKMGADFPPDSIGEPKPGGSAEGVKGKSDAGGATVSDADKSWMGGEFTQQEFDELFNRQEKGQLGDGKADAEPLKVAAEVGKVVAEYGPYSGRFWRLSGDPMKDIPELWEAKSAQKGFWKWYTISKPDLQIGPAEWTRAMREWDKARKGKTAGCEKLPEGGMRENCEKKKEEGAKGKEAALRANLIRLAHAHPEFRKDILPLLKDAGCEKLPEGGMRENCEKKKEEGAEKK